MEKKNMHKSVLLQEVVQFLDPKTGQVYIDATIGFGGHSSEILKKISPNGKLIGIDQDEEALAWLGANLKDKYPNLTLKKENFYDIEKVARENGHKNANGIIADIGVSSYQLDEPMRGFSFKNEGPLDMRMDKDQELTAAEVINTYSEQDLTDIFSKYGEERLSKTIAREIVRERAEKPFKTTLELSLLVQSIYTKKGLKGLKIHPATRTFQALRIEVNDELKSLEIFLPQALDLLAKKGRLAVITFHSLEDRIVKDFFQKEAKGCICPPDYPICKCGHDAKIKILTKKPVLATEKEIKENPRARSAKLRVIEKI
ncbi:MAG: 16S rRNA (cytosine(1402)-N(4))-methyltransferase RsmH [Patescibacteria group bacterium]